VIDRLLEEAVERHPDRPALASGDAVLDYRELGDLAEQLERTIRRAAKGAELRGARIAFVAPNTPLLVAGLFATWRLGAVAVPLSARLRERELEQMLGDAEPLVVFSVSSHMGYSFAELLPRLLPGLSSVRTCLLAASSGEVESELEGVGRGDPEPLGEEIAAILYTSGTTGNPKGVLVKHLRELETARFLAGTLGLGADDPAGLVVPISHAFGLTCMLTTIAAGAEGILVESTFSPAPLLRALEARSATVLHGSPTLFVSLLKTRPEGLPGIRTGLVAGAPAPPELMERLDSTGMRILNCYGLTESGAATCCRPDDPPARLYETCGRAIPGYELRVTGGELELRGRYLTPGYFRRAEETAQAFRDGWFRTGDLATIEQGYLRIVGREKEIVHVGGFNVVPAEVEAVLLAHPEVANAAVVGVPDERMGEALKAFVALRPGSEATAGSLIGFARSRIAGYKVPYAIELLPELPLLPSGKPDRRALAG
jgi:HIP---CoA ligase